MMAEYEYLFAMTLQQKLKERVHGKIFVEVTQDDDLNIYNR